MRISKMIMAIIVLMACCMSIYGQTAPPITITDAGVAVGSATPTPWLAHDQLATAAPPNYWSTYNATPPAGYIPAVQTQATYLYDGSGHITGGPFPCTAYAGLWFDENDPSFTGYPWDAQNDVSVLTTNAHMVYFRTEFVTPTGTLATGLNYQFTADDVLDVFLNGDYLGSVYRTNPGQATPIAVVGPFGYTGYTGASQAIATSGGSSTMYQLNITASMLNGHLKPAGQTNVLAITAQNEWYYCRSINVYTHSDGSPIIAYIENHYDCATGAMTLTPHMKGGSGDYTLSGSFSGTVTNTNPASDLSGAYITATSSGVYILTVTDAAGNSTTTSFTFTAISPLLSASASVSVPVCSTANGTAIVSASGGSGPYVYKWSDNETTPTVNLPAGTYDVTVTDHSGCTADASVTITTFGVTATGIDPTCTAQGFVSAVAGPSTASTTATTYSWANLGTGATYSGPAVPGLSAGTYSVTATNSFCSATTSVVLAAPVNCCPTKPTVSFTFNGIVAQGDTVCSGTPIILKTTTNGAYIQYYIDNGHDTSGVEGLTAGVSIDTLPPTLATLGTHTLCVIAFYSNPDSAGYMPCANDTFCYTFTVKCCTAPIGAVYMDGNTGPDTVCYGSKHVIEMKGSGWARLMFDSIDVNNGFFQIPASGFLLDTVIVDNGTPSGAHQLCLLLYTDTINGCPPSSQCITIYVRECGCGTLYGTSFLVSNNVGGLNYAFHDSFTAIQPDFINWLVDDSTVSQTSAGDTFFYHLGAGHHIVCMQTATVLVADNGSNICCYYTVCDTLNVDACEIWKATDSITYQLSATNVDSVTFTFTGSTSPLSPTIAWDFGDGYTLVSRSLVVTHLYHRNSKGDQTFPVCANVIWSRGDSINYDSLTVCCCVDQICFDVNIGPCYIPHFNIGILDEPFPGIYDFGVTPSNTFTTITSAPHWKSSDGTTDVTWMFTDHIGYSDRYTICTAFPYEVLYHGATYDGCSAEVCIDTFLTGRTVRDYFRTYPNPTTGKMVIEITNYQNAQSARMEISDMTGKPVMIRTFSNLAPGISQNPISIAQLPQGVYTVRMIIGDVQQINKLVKE